MTSTLYDPEVTAVSVGVVELSDAPMPPGVVATAAASRSLTLFVIAFYVPLGFQLPRREGKQYRGSVVY